MTNPDLHLYPAIDLENGPVRAPPAAARCSGPPCSMTAPKQAPPPRQRFSHLHVVDLTVPLPASRQLARR